jgi:hypothetical protein
MAKNKIEAGQCYVYHDHVYMVIELLPIDGVVLQDILTKEIMTTVSRKFIRELRRPFQNFG